MDTSLNQCVVVQTAMPGGSCRVFLGNLPSDCRVEDIEDFFRLVVVENWLPVSVSVSCLLLSQVMGSVLLSFSHIGNLFKFLNKIACCIPLIL